MANQITRVYRNDSETSYIIPGLGEIGPDQRVSVTSEFPPPINLLNYPGLVDVHEEESAGNGRDYEDQPEAPFTPTPPEEVAGALDTSSAPELTPTPEEPVNE